MSVLSLADTTYSLRFLRLLTMPWEKTDAFEQGVIDGEGNKLKNPETKAERESYTVFHRLVFNIRRMLAKLPLGRTTMARYLAAFWLIREHTGMSEDELLKVIGEGLDVDGWDLIGESLTEDVTLDTLPAGEYVLCDDIALQRTGEALCYAGTKVRVNALTEACGAILGVPVFKVWHPGTCQEIFVVESNLKTENMGVSAIATRPMPMGAKKVEESDD